MNGEGEAMAGKLSVNDIDLRLKFLEELRAVDPGPDVLEVIARMERDLQTQRSALLGEQAPGSRRAGGKHHRGMHGFAMRSRLQHT